MKTFVIAALAALAGTLAAQYLVNSNRTVRRIVGGI